MEILSCAKNIPRKPLFGCLVALGFNFAPAWNRRDARLGTAVFGLGMWWLAGYFLPVAQPTSAAPNRHCQRKTDNKATSIGTIDHAT
jgi:hypothetical protein